MLSDYKEIINNWELAINSQGFTNEQVAEQLDTVARKWQSFKDNITGIIANGGSGGISEFIKNFLELGNGLLTWLNNLDSTTWKVISTTLEFAGALWGVHKVWKYISNVIQSYRMSFNEAMASTVASEEAIGVAAATSASEVNSLAMAEERTGSVAIYSADGQRILSTAERQAGRNATMATGGMTGLAVAEGAVGAAGEGGAVGVNRLNVELRKLDISAKTLLIESVVGIAIVALAELTASYFEATSAAQQFGNQKVLELEQQSAAIEIYKEQDEFVHALTSSYVALMQAQKDETLTAEKQANLSKDIEETEKKLSAQLNQGAIERIKNSQDVAAAAEEEYQVFHKTTEQKITAAENEKQAIEEYTKQLKADTATMIEEYQRDRQEFVENIEKKIDALSALESATIALGKVQLWWSRINENAYQHEYDNLNDKVWELEQKENRTAFEERQLKEAKARMDVLNDKIYNEDQYQKDTMMNMQDAHFKGQMDEIKNNIETLKQLDGNGGVRTSAGGGDIVQPSEEKSKSSREPRVQKQKEKDPVVISISNRMKNIESKLNDQLKSLNRIEKNQGTTLDSAKKRNDLYKKAIADMQVEQGKTESHINEVNSQLFDTNVIKMSGAETSVEEINAAVEGFLGQTLANGTEACVEAVVKIGNAMQNQFLSQEFADGVVNVPRLVSDAGDKVIPFDSSQLKPGDIIVYGDNDHVVMYDGQGGYVGNSSSANGGAGGVVHGSDYRQMGGQVPTKIIQSGAREVAVAFNDKLADFLSSTINGETHRVTQDEWDNAGISGQIDLISNAMEDESNKSDDRQKFLQAVKEKLLESVKLLKEAKDKIADLREKAADEWFSSADKAVSQAQKNAERKSNKELFALGNGATESDKARAEVAKTTAALAEYSKFMEDETTKEHENTEAFRDWQDKYLTASKAAVDAQVKLIEAQYNDAMKIIDHNAKMRDYGVDNTEDAWGQKRATDAYADLLTKRKALSKELAELDRTDPKYIEKHNAIKEELVSVNKEIRDASTKHIRTIREGYNKLVQELIFDGKDFGEMLRNLWVDLGRNAWDLLLTGKTDNPSFFAQLLGFGDLNKKDAEKQSETQWSQIQQYTGSIDTKINTTNNYLAQILSVLSTGRTFGYGSYDMSKSFSENLGLTKTYDSSVPITKAIQGNMDSMFKMDKTMFDLNRVLKTSNSITQYNTNSENNLTNKVSQNSGLLNDSNNFLSQVLGFAGQLLGGGGSSGGLLGFAGDLLGGLFGGGSAVSATASIGMPSFTSAVAALPIFANGGSIPKFADGGAPSGRVKGAGTGRSDSILTYLRNKDKFVWLSNGEYVINEKSAKALGYDTLDKLNGYATGGPLDTSITNPTPYVPTINPQVAQRTTNIYGSNKMTEYLLREQNKKMAQQNEMLKNMGTDGGNGKMIVLNTQASSADVLRALQENPRAVQAIMGQQRNMGFR